MTHLGEIKAWFDEAKANGMAYMIVVCDTFDHEDYPIACKDAETCLEKFDAHNGQNMQSVMEVYDIAKGWDGQGKARRAWNLPARP